ncbi:hypothetical protein, partial [Klebsiella pneumoniae]|uniref:hypothetical protein n=1 Tax=Klebsiella pneumoniae TaxID=573 RepID=UPI001C5D35E4
MNQGEANAGRTLEQSMVTLDFCPKLMLNRKKKKETFPPTFAVPALPNRAIQSDIPSSSYS